MKIATIQFAPVFRKKLDNLKKLVPMVSEAASHGSRVVVLPELCTTGYSFMRKEDALAEAETISSGSITYDVMSELAAKTNAYIIYGVVEVKNGKLYNSQVCLSPGGECEVTQKINRWGNDWLWCEAGRSNPPVVDIDGVRVGLLVCRDVRDKVNDKWTDLYSPGDADVVCLSANWGKGGFPSGAWLDFVEENKTALVVSNRYGIEEHNDFGLGGICIIDKSGKVNCEGLVWGKDCIVYGDV